MIWQAISLSLEEYGDNLKKCFHIFDNSKEDGIKYRDGLKNVEFVSEIREASFILACTPYKDSLPIDYIPILNEAYKKERLEDNKERTLLSLAPHLAPIKAAIIPLKKNNEQLVGLAKEIKAGLQSLGLGRVLLENTGNIGKNYRRHDEIGTPVCITVDFDSLDQETVTLRDRDTMAQKTTNISELKKVFTETVKN